MWVAAAVHLPCLNDFCLANTVQTFVILASTYRGGVVVYSRCHVIVFVMRKSMVVKGSSPVELSVLLVIFCGLLDIDGVVCVGYFNGFFSLK